MSKLRDGDASHFVYSLLSFRCSCPQAHDEPNDARQITHTLADDALVCPAHRPPNRFSPPHMLTLFHHPFCPHSRLVRLAVAEHGLECQLIEERAWERRHDFLLMNPAGATPVLVTDGMPAIPSAPIIAEYLDEAYGVRMDDDRLMGQDAGTRVEVRRLMSWFNDKFFEEVSGPLVMERIYKRYMKDEDGGGSPQTDVMRAAHHDDVKVGGAVDGAALEHILHTFI